MKPHAVTTAGSYSYIYDANGNMTSGAGMTITCNYDNMPVTIDGTTCSHDHSGWRVKKVAPPGTTIYFGKLCECTGIRCTKHVLVKYRDNPLNILSWRERIDFLSMYRY